MTIRALLISGALASFAVANAIPLNPGGHVGRNDLAAPGLLTLYTDSPTLLASVTQPFTDPSIAGSVTSAVFQNSLGTLDFYVQVTTTAGSDPVSRVTMFNFDSVTTDVGYRNDGYSIFDNGSVLPNEANRNTNGKVVGFDFDNGLAPNSESFTLVVRTNATQFTAGNVAIIDGISTNVAGFQPVPEPASITGLAIASIAILRRRKK